MFEDLKVVSLTLSRGGSKGVPRKNLALLNGKPLVYYVIRAAQLSNIGEVWISTEDSEIKKVSEGFGAKVIDRPAHMAQDTSKCELSLLQFADNVDFDVLVYIQTTSPLVRPQDINKGIDMVATGEYDSVFSVSRETWIPRWNLDVTPDDWEPKNRPRRQSMPEKYIENGAFYITTKKQLLESGLRYSGNIGVVEMPLSRSFQIDTTQDFELIENIMRGNIQ